MNQSTAVIRQTLHNPNTRAHAPNRAGSPALALLGVLLLVNTWFTHDVRALEAGYAEADITPVLGTPLAGRIERWGRGSERIHDPLTVRCIYLEDGEESVFLLSADLYAVSEELRARVLELAPRNAAADRIVLAATHTHSGPGGMNRGIVRRVNSGRYSPRVLEETAQQFAACMRDAYNVKRRAAVGHTVADWAPPPGFAGVNVQPTPVTVLRIEDSDGAPIAVAITVALMPDNVGTDELLTLSADLPGYVRRTVDDTLGGGAGALVFNGASGDFVRKDMPKSTSWTSIEEMGSAIGLFAVALNDIIECAEQPIAVRSSVKRPPRSLCSAWLPKELRLTQCRIGEFAMTFTPFGVSQGILAADLAQDVAGPHHEIVGYTDGFAGHVVPREAFASDSAAARLHYFGPRMAQELATGIQRLAEDTNDSEEEVPDASEDVDSQPRIEKEDGVLLLNAADKTHGSLLAEIVNASFERRIHEPLAAGRLLPGNQMLAHVPWFVDPSPIALSQLAFELRPAWALLDARQQQRLEAFVDGAELPLEAVWLLQHEEALLHYAGNQLDEHDGGRTLMFAVHGDKAGAEGMLVGIRIPWLHPESPMICQSVSDSGIPVALLAPAHAMGAIAGMNGAGVVACAVRDSERGVPPLGLPPFAMQLERALGLAENKESLLEELRKTASFDGFALFIADTASESAVVIRGAADPESPTLARGLIADRTIASGSIGGERDDFRRPLVDLVERERIVSADNLASIVAELAPSISKDTPREETVAVIFEPKTKRLRVRFVSEESAPEDYTIVPLEAGAP